MAAPCPTSAQRDRDEHRHFGPQVFPWERAGFIPAAGTELGRQCRGATTVGRIIFAALCFIPIKEGPLKELRASPWITIHLWVSVPESALISISREMRGCMGQGRHAGKALLQTGFIYDAERSKFR